MSISTTESLNTQNHCLFSKTAIGEGFLLLSCLGTGRTATVYKARRLSDNKVVALKLGSQDPQAAEMLRQEASILETIRSAVAYEEESLIHSLLLAESASLTSLSNLSKAPYPALGVSPYAESIIKMLDQGETSQGDPYLVLEYVEGRTLAEILQEEGALAENRAINICLKIAAALEYLHSLGILHNDLKPAHIMVFGPNEDICVLDLGLAENMLNSSSWDSIQRSRISGTINYMSPEQARMLPTTACSDVYQLGLLLFECLFGRLPFANLISEALLYRTQGDIIPSFLQAPAAKISYPLKSLLKNCLARNPHKRTSSMTNLRESLEKLSTASSGNIWPRNIWQKLKQAIAAA